MSNNKHENYQGYIYPDGEDVFTMALIEASEPYPGYWQASEDDVLDRGIKMITKNGLKGSLLDVGCGFGRLLLKFSQYFDLLYGVEPDRERFEVCKKNITEWGMEEKVRLYNGTVDMLEDKLRFDVILCSHVVQHIPEQTSRQLLKALRKLLKDNGLLIVSTSHSDTDKDIFLKNYIDVEGKRVEEKISQAEFNSFENRNGVLPTKKFSGDNLLKLLENSGFKAVDSRVYHDNRGSRYIHKLFGTDRLINTLGSLKKTRGRDICVIAGKD